MTSRRSSKKSQSNSITGEASNSGENQDEAKELFPIVAIGASAGGLEAFTQLLDHLPTDTGMAFVLIQHLSPNQKSLLSEILSKKTQMPVHEVEDEMVVEPNHVYVIPPNAKMTISQGVLKLSPREKIRGHCMTVDAFFISLAEERGSKAIAVVLSGGDADGARGLEVIKGAGGITFAQSEDTAQVANMPNTAIAYGYVDFILPPQEIAEELVKISNHPYVASSTPIKPSEVLPAENTDAMSKIFSLLRISTGVDFSYYKETTVKRRILRRMIVYKLERLEDYVKYLQEQPDEVKALYQDVLIPVSSFFRDSEAFEALKTNVFPNISKNRTPQSPLRIWVAGCSTGEEAYSIAICLLEYLTTQGINLPIQIFATDINEVAIEKARNAIYKPSQVANISPERLQRFFVQVENGYQISKVVRELCVFARQNPIVDPPFSRMDLITCRNVLIYLGSRAQKKLLPIFHYALQSTGYLMLGTSETVGEFTDLFALIDRKYKLYLRKRAFAQPNIDLLPNPYPVETINSRRPVNNDVSNDLEIQKEADGIVLNRYSPAGVIINSDLEILQFRGQTSSYLQPAPGRPSFNVLKMVKEDLRLELRTAIHQAKKEQHSITKEGLQLRDGDGFKQVKLNVIPFKSSTGESYFLILFEEIPSPLNTAPQATGDRRLKSKRSSQQDQEIIQLKQELATTKEHLQSIIEEQQATNQNLRAANEEILSSNEELQSTNEELETAKEEIQATNEELSTINDELQRRNIESTQVTNDLLNLLSSINIPILMLGGDLRIRRFTPSAQPIFNLIPTDVGRPLSDINHSLNIADLEKQILEVISNLNLKAQEVEDQEGHFYDLRIRPYRTIDNKIDGVTIVLLDIDAMKRTAAQLRGSRDYAEAIVNTVREALVVLNTELRVVSANQTFYEMFNVLPLETERRLIFEIGNGEWNLESLRSLLDSFLPNDIPSQDVEAEYNFENVQKTIRFNARKIPKIDEQQLILLMIEDITQRKEWDRERTHLLAQEQLARTAAQTANRAKDEFLSILSHELRNPLNIMLGWAQLLRTHQLDEDSISQGLEAIEKSIKVQARLIEDLLDISRITSGKLRLVTASIELAPVVEATIRLVRSLADSKNIQIQSQLQPSTRRILGDGDRLQQVIWNLLTNAIKFTPDGGRIEVLLQYTDKQAQLQVSDTGQGISADFLPYIFDRFSQADTSKTRSKTGLGLGLSIVRSIVELHDGTVEAHSPGEGQGATFIIKLPLETNLKATSAPNATQPAILEEQLLSQDAIPSVDGLRVLVVDDETHVRELLITMLEVYGIEVTAVASARQALSILTANPGGYDLLLSDISMPEEDGYTLIRQVRALSPESGGQIPAVALTAHARDRERGEALSAGFQVHLAKPVEPSRLLLVVACLTGRLKIN